MFGPVNNNNKLVDPYDPLKLGLFDSTGKLLELGKSLSESLDNWTHVKYAKYGDAELRDGVLFLNK